MRRLALLLLLLAPLGAAERTIAFDGDELSVPALLARVEAQAGVRVDLPYALPGNALLRPPAGAMSVREALFLVARHSAGQGLALRVVEQDGVFRFVPACRLTDRELRELLGRKLRLEGKALTVADALAQASAQAGVPVRLSVPDSAAVRADYAYDCTLGEFLDEVAAYFRARNRVHLGRACGPEGVELFGNGAVAVAADGTAL